MLAQLSIRKAFDPRLEWQLFTATRRVAVAWIWIAAVWDHSGKRQEIVWQSRNVRTRRKQREIYIHSYKYTREVVVCKEKPGREERQRSSETESFSLWNENRLTSRFRKRANRSTRNVAKWRKKKGKKHLLAQRTFLSWTRLDLATSETTTANERCLLSIRDHFFNFYTAVTLATARRKHLAFRRPHLVAKEIMYPDVWLSFYYIITS